MAVRATHISLMIAYFNRRHDPEFGEQCYDNPTNVLPSGPSLADL
jgi:hypothetical protein